MKLRRRNLLVLLGFAIAAALLLTLWREHEPRYQDKSLSQWAHIINRGPGDDDRQKAEHAVRQIGTNGLPFLMRWIQYERRPWRTRLALLCFKLPEPLGSTARDLILGSGEQMQYDAFCALHALGPLGEPAIPILARQVRDLNVSDSAAWALANIGDAALPPILTIITNAAEPPGLRMHLMNSAYFSWAQFTQTNAIQSTLAQCLDDQNAEVATCAAGVICNHNPADEHAMRVLTRGLESAMQHPHQIAVRYVRAYLAKIPTTEALQYLQDTNSSLSPYAAEALGELAQKENSVLLILPALTNALHDSRHLVRSYCAMSLALFGDKAEPAVPALLDAFSDPDFFVRSAATNALFRIPAYSVLRDLAMMERYGIRPSAADIHYRGFFKYQPSSPLAHLLEHRDPRIREMATNAFRELKENGARNEP
jgi:HEAT repeat protein